MCSICSVSQKILWLTITNKNNALKMCIWARKKRKQASWNFLKHLMHKSFQVYSVTIGYNFTQTGWISNFNSFFKLLYYSFFQLFTHKIFSCHTISETSHSKCKTTHQISKTISYFSAFDSVFNCIKHSFQNTTHNSLPKTQKSNRKWLAFLFQTQPIKMLHLFTRSHTHSSHVQTLTDH